MIVVRRRLLALATPVCVQCDPGKDQPNSCNFDHGTAFL